MSLAPSKPNLEPLPPRMHPPASRMKWCLALVLVTVVAGCIFIAGETLLHDSSRVGLHDFEISTVVDASVVHGKKPPREVLPRHPVEDFQDFITAVEVSTRNTSGASKPTPNRKSSEITIHTTSALTTSPLQLPLCGTLPTSSRNGFGIPYTTGEWIEVEKDLVTFTNASVEISGVASKKSDDAALIPSIAATDAGLRRVQHLKKAFAACSDHPRACLIKHNATGAARVVQSMNWRWRPTTCALTDMSFEALPAWLKARSANLWFVGDSLNADMGEQLSCYLKHTAAPAEIQKRIRVVRMDRLGASPAHREKPWGALGITPSDIVVLNAGAHWYGDVKNSQAAFQNVSKIILNDVNPRAVLFRTTVMGHHRCEAFLHPFATLRSTERDTLASKYNWRTFDDLNRKIADAFLATWPPEKFRVLDVSMFELRGDGHVTYGTVQPCAVRYSSVIACERVCECVSVSVNVSVDTCVCL
eukprot:m.381908 g.381908  ORF g.381908 m.381908 type:complete len:474 (-) comp20970_c1_seq19:2037-3458(-)